ncbi:Exportin-4, partial [Globisporangium splendens]
MEALEAACFALHAPPSGLEAERKRAEAEAVLDHFKRSPRALQDAMAMVETTTHPVVQFHCVATIREVTLKQWTSLTLAEKAQPLDFVMRFLWQKYAELPHFVSSAMLQTVVLLMKRGWLERAATERDAIIQQMGNMLGAGDGAASATTVTTRLIAAKWLLAFVTEFSSASRASAMFQPVEFHTKSRKTLEKQGLKQLLGFAVHLLEDLIRTTTACSTPDASSGNLLNVPKEQLELLETAFMLCVEILNWNFGDAMMGNLTWSLSASSEKDDESKAVIIPQSAWRDVLVRPELIHSAFNTYAFFRSLATRNETLLHLARQYLIQLASLQGPIFERKDEKMQFLSEIFRGTSALIHNPFLELIGKTDYAAYEIATREMIDMCQLLFRLVNNMGLQGLVQSSTQIFSPFVEELSSLSCKLLQSALERIQQHLRLRNNEPVDDLWQLEGVDILLDAWVALVNDQFFDSATTTSGAAAPSTDAASVSALLSKYSAPVVELYLQVQLELCAVDALAEQDENEDVEDDSASGTREQIELAAALARMNAASSSALLMNLLQSFVSGIQHALGALNGRDEMTPELNQLIEKLHFMVLFTGLFLSDEYVSERPCIPPRIHAAVQATSSEPSQVVNLLLLVMSQLLEFEANRIVQNPRSSCISPFFSEQLFSTTTRLCATYLAPDALAHDDAVAPALLQVFGFQNGGRAGELISFIVQQCAIYLIHWPTQPVVMQNLMDFLLVLSKTNAISCVLHSPFWQSLVQSNASAGTFLVAGGGGDQLQAAVARIPSALRGQLTEALCRAGMTSEDDAMRKSHFDAVARPVETRLQSLIAMPNFESKQTANDIRVQEELKLILEMYSGIARSSESKSHGLISAFCLPALPVIVRVFHIFHGDSQIVDLTLTFFCFLVEAQICYLTPRDALQVYTSCNELIRTYCRHHAGRVSVLGDAEEEKYSDLLALLQLLSHLVSKDFIDFSDHTAEQSDVDKATGVVAEVVFAGLSQVIPMMTEQLLQYPSLSKQYFTLVSYMVEVYAEKLALLETELFSMLLKSLLFGIRHMQVEVVRYSFQAIGELAGFHWKAREKNELGLQKHLVANPDIFVHFIRVIFRMAMFEDFNPLILDACAGALYPLILIEQARYFSLAEEMSNEQIEPASQQRLLAAFGALTQFLTPADIAMGTASTRKFRTQFKSNLFVFVADVRGFIQVK